MWVQVYRSVYPSSLNSERKYVDIGKSDLARNTLTIGTSVIYIYTKHYISILFKCYTCYALIRMYPASQLCVCVHVHVCVACVCMCSMCMYIRVCLFMCI